MYHPFIVGKKVYLRALVKEDLCGDYFNWLNDREVTKYLESGVFPNTQEGMESWFKGLGDRNVVFAVIVKDRHIGNVRLGPISWIHRHAPIGIMIGNKAFWGKGYGTEVIKLVTDYAFQRLNLRKVWAGVVEGNIGSIKAFQRAGFDIEGTHKGEFFLEGSYLDTIHFGRFNGV